MQAARARGMRKRHTQGAFTRGSSRNLMRDAHASSTRRRQTREANSRDMRKSHTQEAYAGDPIRELARDAHASRTRNAQTQGASARGMRKRHTPEAHARGTRPRHTQEAHARSTRQSQPQQVDSPGPINLTSPRTMWIGKNGYVGALAFPLYCVLRHIVNSPSL